MWNDSFLQCRPCGISNEGSSQETDRYGDRAEWKVSFDPNLRFSLWDDLDQLKETVNDFLKYADIIKISDEELEFITGHTDIKDALDGLFADRAKYVIYTKGADGAEVYTRNGMVEASGYKIDVRDTTGAGDSFIGAFLYCLLNDEVEDLESVSDDTLRNYLDFANAYAANTTTKEGALAAMADRAEMDEWMKTLKNKSLYIIEERRAECSIWLFFSPFMESKNA